MTENLSIRFGNDGLDLKVEVPLHKGEKTLAQAVGRINREGRYAKVYSDDWIKKTEHIDPYSAYEYTREEWTAECGLTIYSETGEKVGRIKFLNPGDGNRHLFEGASWRDGYATDWKLTLSDPADKEAQFTIYEIKNGVRIPKK
jgi:hypothetical protein